MLLLSVLAAGAEEHDEGPAPTLEALDFSQGTYQGGDRMDIQVVVHHPDGVRSLGLVLLDPDLDEVYSDTCTKPRKDAYDNWPTTARESCHLELPRAAKTGNYTVDRVLVTTGIEQPFELVRGEDWNGAAGIEESAEVQEAPPDTSPPELVAIGIEPLLVDPGGHVTINVTSNDTVGLNRTHLLIDDGSGGTLRGDCRVPGEGVLMIPCVVPVPSDAPGGTYTIRWVELYDTQLNMLRAERGKDLVSSEAFVIRFNVTEERFDTTPPVLLSYVTPDVPLRVGDEVVVRVQAEDDTDIVSMSVVFMSLENGASFASLACEPLGNPADAACFARLTSAMPLGRHRVLFISMRDSAGNQGGFPVGPPPEDAPDRDALLDDMGFTLLPATLRTTGGAGEGLVAGLAPATPDAVPGTVVTFLVVAGEGHAIQNISMRLATSNGDQLGVQDCAADVHPVPGGFRCRMLVPPGTPKSLYRLEELRVRADGGDWQPVDVDLDHAPRLFVGGSAPGLDAVPQDWQRHVQGGVTLPTFTGERPARPSGAVPPADAVTPPGTPPDQEGPVPLAVAAVAVAVALRVHRRRCRCGPGGHRSGPRR